MENKQVIVDDKKSCMKIDNRKRLSLTGIIEVISFNEEAILLNTNLGTLSIKGEGLKMNKLDVQNGEIIITGMINSCVYTSAEVKHKKESLISKMFK